MTNKSSYMHFVSYKNFHLWDVKRYCFEGYKFDKSVRLGEILFPYDKTVTSDILSKNNWPIISKINFSGLLFLRDLAEIETYKGKLHLIDGDTLIYSKINVRHGCVYFHESSKLPFAVSSEYPAYKLDSSRVYGPFLVKLLQSSYFKKTLSMQTTGISKARVKPNAFLDIQIPLPTLEEQKALVDSYQEKLQDASNLDESLSVIADEIDTFVLGKLEVTKHSSMTFDGKDSRFSFLKFISSSNISRWDVFNEKQELRSWKYENTTLSRVLLEKPAYGAGYKSAKKPNDIRYIRITDINEDGTLNDEFVSANEYEEKYLLKPNDFLIARSGNTVGKTFLYESKWGKAIFAGYLIRFVLDTEKINPYYLLAYTKSSIFKKWITNNMRVSGQPNINSQQYLDASLILPPLSVQQDIVDEVQKRRAKIASCREHAAKLRQDAIAQFEQAIFK